MKLCTTRSRVRHGRCIRLGNVLVQSDLTVDRWRRRVFSVQALLGGCKYHHTDKEFNLQ